jgi:hypothetical protein
MLTAEHIDLRFIIHLIVIDQCQAAIINDSFTGDSPLPIIELVERTAHIDLFV